MLRGRISYSALLRPALGLRGRTTNGKDAGSENIKKTFPPPATYLPEKRTGVLTVLAALLHDYLLP